MRTYYTYMLASRQHGTLYTGVTNGLVHRIRQHRDGKGSKFTQRYAVNQLVRYQAFNTIDEAIQREKTMKDWPRQWKVNLIERDNPNWLDLYPTLPGAELDQRLCSSGKMDPGDKHRDDGE